MQISKKKARSSSVNRSRVAEDPSGATVCSRYIGIDIYLLRILEIKKYTKNNR